MPRKIKRYNAKTFYETISFGGASFSPDETRILVSSDASGIFNLYSQPVGGGAPEQLTHSETDATIGVSFFPGDDRILYSSDQGGNELNHLYVLEEDGKIVDLTPGENLKASFLDWSGDETCLWTLTNERDPKYFDLYRYDVRNYRREMVYENSGGYGTVDAMSRDGRWVALLKMRNNADNDIYVWDARNPGEPPKLVTPHEGDVDHAISDFSPDGGELLYLSNGGGEFMGLWAYDLESGEHRLLEEADWDIMYSYFSRNGLYRITGINVDAKTEITVLDLKVKKAVMLPDIPSGDITGVNISKSGRYMAFYVNGDTSPSNLHVLVIETGEHRKLTESLNPAIDERLYVTRASTGS